jgi:hypothetical protein
MGPVIHIAIHQTRKSFNHDHRELLTLDILVVEIDGLIGPAVVVGEIIVK